MLMAWYARVLPCLFLWSVACFAGLGDTAFDMADGGRTGLMSFEMLVRFMVVMTKSKKGEKTAFCFNLFDGAMNPPWTDVSPTLSFVPLASCCAHVSFACVACVSSQTTAACTYPSWYARRATLLP